MEPLLGIPGGHELLQVELLHPGDGGPEAFFNVTPLDLDLPPMARMAPSQPCDGCGEPVMQTKLSDSGGRKLCRSCLKA